MKLLLPIVTFVALLCAACGGDDDAPSQITVSADVIESDAPVDVEATSVSVNESGEFELAVRVTWEGSQTARLDDARFTGETVTGRLSSDSTTKQGYLITVGRGCGTSWDDQLGVLQIACTADLQLILLEPGESHDYPVRIPVEVGPRRLEPGNYVVEEPIHWWLQEGIEAPPTAEGEFTIRLTFEVE